MASYLSASRGAEFQERRLERVGVERGNQVCVYWSRYEVADIQHRDVLHSLPLRHNGRDAAVTGSKFIYLDTSDPAPQFSLR